MKLIWFKLEFGHSGIWIFTLTRRSVLLFAQIGQGGWQGLRHFGRRGGGRGGHGPRLRCISVAFHNQIRCTCPVFRFRSFRIMFYHGGILRNWEGDGRCEIHSLQLCTQIALPRTKDSGVSGSSGGVEHFPTSLLPFLWCGKIRFWNGREE